MRGFIDYLTLVFLFRGVANGIFSWGVYYGYGLAYVFGICPFCCFMDFRPCFIPLAWPKFSKFVQFAQFYGLFDHVFLFRGVANGIFSWGVYYGYGLAYVFGIYITEVSKGSLKKVISLMTRPLRGRGGGG